MMEIESQVQAMISWKRQIIGGSMIALILLAFICLFTLLTGTGEDDHRRGGSVL